MVNANIIRVLLVYYEPFPSGQTTHVLSLVEGLDPARFNVRVFLPDGLAPIAELFEKAGAKVILAPFSKTCWKTAARSSLFEQIRLDPNAIVHFHSQEAALLGRPLAKMAGARRILYTPQTIDIRKKYLQTVYAAIEVGLAKVTEKVLSVNDADRVRLNSWGIPAEKLITIYNGIDLEKYPPNSNLLELRKALGVETDCPLVVQIGRMSAQKAPFDFIAGAAIVLQELPKVRFVMIGDGPLLSAVRKRVHDLGLEQNIFMAGSIENAHRFIPAADVVTLTSKWEGAPYSLLEAMAYARPVVATTVNGCPEIVAHQHSGLLVPPGNPRQWASAVIELLNHPEKASHYGQNGRRRVELSFTLPAMIQKVEALYTGTVVSNQSEEEIPLSAQSFSGKT